jgi:hypothetical protein
LGFLYADGNVGVYGSDYCVRLNLNIKDSEILDVFIKCLETNRGWKIDGRGDVYLGIFNKILCLSLINKGVVQAKTFKIKFPSLDIVPNHLIHHFIRGYFDGDGTMAVSRKHWNGTQAAIISNYDFIIGLKRHLTSIGFSDRKITKVWSKKYKTKKCGVYHIGGFNNIKKFHDYIYNGANFYLKRKREKFNEYFVRRENDIKKDWNKLYSFELISPDGKFYKFASLKEMRSVTNFSKYSYYKLIKNKTKAVKGWTLPDKTYVSP